MLVTAAVEIEVTAFIKDELPRLHRRRSVGGWLRRPALACMALCSAAAAAPLRVPLVPGHAGSSRRIGEARHPGPRRARRADPIDVEDRQFTVASWNPGSLHAAAQAVLLSWSVDVIAFQESRLDLQGQRRVALDSDGSWSFAFGPARQPQLDARGHKFVPQGGVAIAARRPASIAVEPPLNPAEDLLWHTGRWVATVVPVLSGAWQLAVHNYYGVSGASMDHVAAAANERNLALLFLAASARDVPTVIVMDGNVNPGHSAAMQAALQTGSGSMWLTPGAIGTPLSTSPRTTALAAFPRSPTLTWSLTRASTRSSSTDACGRWLLASRGGHAHRPGHSPARAPFLKARHPAALAARKRTVHP